MNDEFTYNWEQAVDWLRKQPSQQDLVRHCYYDDPLESAAERFYCSEEWSAIQSLLGSSLKGDVLDLGAGRGISSYAFARDGCNVTALEPDSSSLVGAGAIRTLFKESRLPVQIVQEYGESLPFAEKRFDIVYGRAVLHHAFDLPQLCKEVRRVLKQDGVFIATREHVISKKSDLQVFLKNHPLHSLYGGENAFLLKEYTQAIRKANLQIQHVIGPMDSVINYAPLTRSEFCEILSSLLKRVVGSALAKKLSRNNTVQRLFGRLVSMKSTSPGRLYSFIAVKQ